MFLSGTSGALGDGVARLAFDDEFIQGRVVRDATKPATNVGTELREGAWTVAANVSDAFRSE